jgi:hypothetical protein
VADRFELSCGKKLTDARTDARTDTLTDTLIETEHQKGADQGDIEEDQENSERLFITFLLFLADPGHLVPPNEFMFFLIYRLLCAGGYIM